MSDCCANYGGFITFEAGDDRLGIRGEITEDLYNFTREGAAHSDGSVYTTTTPRPYRVRVSFSEPCDPAWEERLKGCTINVTVTGDDGRQTLYTAARMVGDVQKNFMTGEITGLEFVTSQRRRVGAAA